MTLTAEIGSRMRDCRKKYGLTQEQFSEKLGVSKTFYGNVERGKQMLSLERLVFFHKEFDIDLNYLLAGEKVCDSSFLKSLAMIPPENQHDVEQVMHHIQNICKQHTHATQGDSSETEG